MRKDRTLSMEEKYYYWLHNIAGIGKETRKKLLKIVTPGELYHGSLDNIKPLLKKKQLESLEESRRKWDLEKEWKSLEERNIKFFYYGSENYPAKLKEIPDAPSGIYIKGKTDLFSKPSVAVVGTRNCSAYGGLAAKELGKELAKMGIVVVSGMARGIDGICQWAALEQGGESVGVLGSGVEVCYPKENRFLYDRLQEQGCLISENSPFTQPRAGLFPMRNRIISGLADMIVVVEARERSGTLITVDMALEQGKDVFAMPGRMTDRDSRGCNRLIKQGAGMVLSPREFVEEICPVLKLKYQKKDTEENFYENLTREEKRLLAVIETEPKNIEEIYWELRKELPEMTLGKMMEGLLQLKVKQKAEEREGYYCAYREK